MSSVFETATSNPNLIKPGTSGAALMVTIMMILRNNNLGNHTTTTTTTTTNNNNTTNSSDNDNDNDADSAPEALGLPTSAVIASIDIIILIKYYNY